MKTKKRYISGILCILLALSLILGACANNGAPATPGDDGAAATTDDTDVPTTDDDTNDDYLPFVHLTGIVPGDPSPAQDEVMEVMNAMLLEDINATIEFRYLNWGEFFERYPLIMAAGEVLDFAYIAEWNNFTSYAARGAYLEITDLVPVYAPDIWRIAHPDAWHSGSFQGRIYGIPHDGASPQTTGGFVFREDLRVLHGVPELTDIRSLEAYMQAIHANEPGMSTYSMDAVNNNMLFRHAQFEKTGWSFDFFGLVYDREDPDARIFLKYEEPEFAELVELMHDWQQQGFWDTSVLATATFVNQVDQHPFAQGFSAFFGLGTGDYGNVNDFIEDHNMDWEAGFFWVTSPSGHIDRTPLLNDGVAVVSTSENPERTLMAMNLLLTDPRYQWLLAYGIEGEHYVVDEDGWGTLPEGISPDEAPIHFWMHPFSWFLYDSGGFPPPRDTAAHHLSLEMEAVASAPTLLGFQFDTSELESELAALNDVWMEFEIPLAWGFIRGDSVQDDIDTLIEQSRAAGIDRVREELQRQVDEFLGN